MADTCAQAPANDSPMNFVITTNAIRGEVRDVGWERGRLRKGTLRFWLGGGCCYGSGFAPPPVVRTQPGNRGLFRGLNIHTPPPVGGVYRLRATPTRRRGTDTRYQRTLVAPTSIERRRSAVSLPSFCPSTAAIFHVLIFPPPPSPRAACACAPYHLSEYNAIG